MRLIDFILESPALAGTDARFIDIDNDVSLSYQDVLTISRQLALFLVEKGVKPGDVVATYAPNSVSAYCCIFAISQTGALWLPLNVKGTIESNLKLFETAGAVKLFLEQDILDKHPLISERLPGEAIIGFNGKSIANQDIQSWNYENHKSLNYTAPSIDNDLALVSLFATGGTTGDSKLAEWSAMTWKTMAEIQMEMMPDPDIPACYLVSAPMSHAAGVSSFAPMLQGASIVVMDGMVPEKLLPAIKNYRVTHLFLPPTAIYMLLAHEDIHQHDYSSLRYFWYAAAPMSVEKLKEAMAVFGPVMVQSYGQAESPMLCAFLSINDHISAFEEKNFSILRSCGKATPRVEVGIMDDDGNLLPPDQEGEIVVKGNLLMRAYYQCPENTSSIRVNGWQRTGDIGVLDQNGYLYIVDRKRDMIISGGFNVYPGEIEQLIWAHPAIKDCAVIGVPDEKWGEQVTAVVELKDRSKMPDEQEIIKLCKNKLGSIKAPKKILFWDELPRSPVGKVLKKDIRRVFWEKSGRNI